jgi:hypothetical protein
MRRAFPSYRRDDTQFITSFLYGELEAATAFGPGSVFMDIDDVPPGVGFREVIDEAVSQCEFFLAIIGKQWATPRLQNPNDLVRLEIEAALRRQIPVTPVLVDGATMPKVNRFGMTQDRPLPAAAGAMVSRWDSPPSVTTSPPRGTPRGASIGRRPGRTGPRSGGGSGGGGRVGGRSARSGPGSPSTHLPVRVLGCERGGGRTGRRASGAVGTAGYSRSPGPRVNGAMSVAVFNPSP